jgi:hypothetical protein
MSISSVSGASAALAQQLPNQLQAAQSPAQVSLSSAMAQADPSQQAAPVHHHHHHHHHDDDGTASVQKSAGEQSAPAATTPTAVNTVA